MDSLNVGCHVRYVPETLVVPAAQTAIAENPANRPAVNMLAHTGLVLPPEHMALLVSRYWGSNGVKLTVGFMEAISDELADRILSHMNAWNQWANVEFTRSKTSPQVRITREGDGYWSYLGTDITHIPANEPTMCLQAFSMSTPESEYKRVVRHETAHTLGAPHEHMRAGIINRLDPDKTIAYFQQTQGWSRQMVIQQVLTPLDESQLRETSEADEQSIMTYMLPGSITKDGKPIIGGSDIDANDRVFIASIYPKPGTPPSPPPPVKPTKKGSEWALSVAASIAQIGGWTVTKSDDPSKRVVISQ